MHLARYWRTAAVAACLFASPVAANQYDNPNGSVSPGVVPEVSGGAIGPSNPLPAQMQASSGPGGVAPLSRIPSSGASNNLTLAKNAPGRAYAYQGCNTTASAIYMRVYNAASAGAVTPGTTPVFAGPYVFAANTCVPPTNVAGDMGIFASVGLVYEFGTSFLDTDTSAIAAGAITAFQLSGQ